MDFYYSCLFVIYEVVKMDCLLIKQNIARNHSLSKCSFTNNNMICQWFKKEIVLFFFFLFHLLIKIYYLHKINDVKIVRCLLFIFFLLIKSLESFFFIYFWLIYLAMMTSYALYKHKTPYEIFAFVCLFCFTIFSIYFVMSRHKNRLNIL